MKSTVRIISRISLLAAAGILLSLLYKADANAGTLTVVVNPEDSGTVTVNGEVPQGTLSGDSTCQRPLAATAASNYRFDHWGISGITSEDMDECISGDLDSPTITIYPLCYDITATAYFVLEEQEPVEPSTPDNPPVDPPADPPANPPSDPPNDDPPDPTQTLEYFLEGVSTQVKELQNKLNAVANDPDALKTLKTKGLMIDAGNWCSFNASTCAELDNLIKQGVPVTIKYLYKGELKTINIPANYKYTLKEMCDETNFVGFEYIYASIANGKPIDRNTPKEATHNTVMGAEVGMAALSAGNDFVGAATEGLGLASNIGADGVSSYAQMGGGSLRQETG